MVSTLPLDILPHDAWAWEPVLLKYASCADRVDAGGAFGPDIFFSAWQTQGEAFPIGRMELLKMQMCAYVCVGRLG